MKRVSIVVPAYNEAENLARLHEAVSSVFADLPYDLELVLVSDGSTDATPAVLAELAAKDSRVKFIEFKKNAGQQAATSAGLNYATGDVVMIMDADLQHPPRLIPEFIQRWEEGGELVFGVRKGRPGEGIERRFVSYITGKLYNAGTGLPTGVSDFCLLDRSIVDAFKKIPPDRRMTRVRLGNIKGKRVYVYYDIDLRAAGERKYTAKKLLKLFTDNMFNYKLPEGTMLYEVGNTNFHG